MLAGALLLAGGINMLLKFVRVRRFCRVAGLNLDPEQVSDTISPFRAPVSEIKERELETAMRRADRRYVAGHFAAANAGYTAIIEHRDFQTLLPPLYEGKTARGDGDRQPESGNATGPSADAGTNSRCKLATAPRARQDSGEGFLCCAPGPRGIAAWRQSSDLAPLGLGLSYAPAPGVPRAGHSARTLRPWLCHPGPLGRTATATARDLEDRATNGGRQRRAIWQNALRTADGNGTLPAPLIRREDRAARRGPTTGEGTPRTVCGRWHQQPVQAGGTAPRARQGSGEGFLCCTPGPGAGPPALGQFGH